MDGSLRKTDVSRNIVKLLQGRERKSEVCTLLHQRSQFTETLVKRLGLEHELEGHQGCVNCLQWSSDGRRLASGSDDTNVLLWDPFRHRLLTVLHTPHIGNIFSVKFLGSDDSLIATGAGDCRVVVRSVEQASHQTPHLDCGCHVGRVKRLATSPDEPLVFWSASEDGLVIQYDMREPHECMSKSKVFIDLSYTSEVKCIAVNPVRSHLIAIGANDCFIRLFDRRMVKTTTYRPNHTFDPRKRTPPEPQDPGCVQYYAPGHLARDFRGDMSYKLVATYVTFDSTGSDMLVNMGGEQIYLFDINNPRYVSELRVPSNFSRRNNSYNSCCNSICHRSNGTTVTASRKLFKFNKRISSKPCACDYIERARSLFHRKWIGDYYSAARDYLYVIQQWPENVEAYVGLIQCLIALNWTEEAYQWLEYFCSNHAELAESAQVRGLHTDITSRKKKKENDNTNEKAFSDEEKQLRLESRDYETHFIGHCNTTTDIKEANFLGKNGDFICAGSDDGVIFIWNRRTTNIATALWGDVSIVNCVQPHPSACFIATSGIDPVVKLWSPMGEEGTENTRIVGDTWAAVEANQQRMVMDPFETMLANMGYRVSPLEGHDAPTCRTS